MSLVLTIWTVWYVDSLTPAGGKVTLFEGLIFTIGMNGCEPGGKEWPTNLTFRQVGGSRSSFNASSNLVFLRVLNNVLPIVFYAIDYEFAPTELLKAIFLTLLLAPFINWMKH